MGNQKIIEGLKEVSEGLMKVISALESGESTEIMNTPVEDKPVKAEKVSTKKEGAKEEELMGLKYNELKKLASSLGVSASGKREDIISRILSVDGAVVEEKQEEEAKDNKVIDFPKKNTKEEKEPDEFDTLAQEVIEENGIEAVIDELKANSIKANKKNALKYLAQALRDGIITLDEEDDEEDDEEEVEKPFGASDDEEEDDYDDDEGEEVTAETYFEDYDEEGINDPRTNTNDRISAMREEMQKQIDAIENEDIEISDMKNYLEELSTEDEIKEQKSWEENDFVAAYLEMNKKMIDEDGDKHEPSEAYQIGDDFFCCGHKLIYDKKSDEYICPVCEQTYEA